MIIAENVPLQPNVNRLSTSLGTTRDSLLKLLYNLDKAEILELLTVELKNYKKLVNPEKIYLGNTNLMYALSPKIDVSTLRETFFIDQLSAVGTVQTPLKGDFLVNGKYLFEVGGESKEFNQIAGTPTATWLLTASKPVIALASLCGCSAFSINRIQNKDILSLRFHLC